MNEVPSSPEIPDDLELIKQLESLGVAFRKSKKGRILVVDFRNCHSVIDDSIGIQLNRLPRLKEIYLEQSQVTDQTLVALSQLKRLQTLNLDETCVSDQAMDELLQCPKLSLLSLNGTQVTRDKVAEMRKKMIGTRIVFRS